MGTPAWGLWYAKEKRWFAGPSGIIFWTNNTKVAEAQLANIPLEYQENWVVKDFDA